MDRLDSGFCVKCGGILLDINAPLQMCSQCEKWATTKTRNLVASRKQMSPEHKRNRKKLKVGILR